MWVKKCECFRRKAYLLYNFLVRNTERKDYLCLCKDPISSIYKSRPQCANPQQIISPDNIMKL